MIASRMRLVTVVSVLALSVGCAGQQATPSAPQPKAVHAAPAAGPDDSWRNAIPGSGDASVVSYPATSEERLPNGVRLYFIRRPTPTVDVQIVVQSSVSSLPVGKSGLAAVAARMMTEGTTNRSALELQIAAESLGSELQQSAERDAIKVGLEVLPGDVPAALSLLAEVIQKPAFRDADLQRVKEEWNDQLMGERQSPMRLAQLAGLRAVLGMQAGAPVSGSPADVKKLARRDLTGWHTAHVTPTTTSVVVVGDIDSGQLLQQANELFGSWSAKAGVPAPEPALPAAQSTRILLVDRPGAVQTALFALQPFPSRNQPGHEAREVMTSLFGGLFTSRLNMNLREEHAYTYGARASLIATRLFGLFALSTSVERDVTAESVEQMLYELRALRDPALNKPLTAQEIQRAKADLTHELGASLEHTGHIAGNVGEQITLGLPLDYYARYPSLIEGLGSDAIQQAAQLVDPAQLLIVVVGDRAVIEDKLRALKLTVLTADAKLTE